MKLFEILDNIQSPPLVKEILIHWMLHDEEKLFTSILHTAFDIDEHSFIEILGAFNSSKYHESDRAVIDAVLKSSLNPSVLTLFSYVCSDASNPLNSYLNKNGISTDRLSREIKKLAGGNQTNACLFGLAGDKLDEPVLQKQKGLASGVTDLISKSIKNEYDDIIDRPELELKILLVLARAEKSNVLLVGDTRSGKTSMVKLLARKIDRDEIPWLNGKKILQFELSKMLKNTIYRGQFEARIHDFFDSLDKDSIVFIDEIHTVTGNGFMPNNAANILKPYLDSPELTVIGATTTPEFKKYIEGDIAFKSRFEVIEIPPLSRSEISIVIETKRKKYENTYKIEIPHDILGPLIAMTEHFCSDKSFAESAINILQSACLLCQKKTQASLSAIHLVYAISLYTGKSKEEIFMFYYK